MSGRLFIIATPIGNLGDLTQRAKQALHDCELVLSEDTRVTLKLLNHLGLKKRLISCHSFNESKRLVWLEELAARQASVALVCDAGTPLICDPGFEIVQKAISAGMTVVPVPGPAAALAALVASGLPCQRFAFEGFLPERKHDRLKRLTELKRESRTMIFYIAPHDLSSKLEELLLAFGDRQACLAREITKLHEEFLRGSLSLLLKLIANHKVRGECTLVVAGTPVEAVETLNLTQIIDELSEHLKGGLSFKDASKSVATKLGVPKSKVYKLGLEYLMKSSCPQEGSR